MGPASTITISRLDQLDASSLRQLDLLHVRMIEAPNGRSLNDIIYAIAGALPDNSARRALENALLRRGLMPDDESARNVPRIQLRNIEAYSVTDGFPKLTRDTVPVAITEATYVLEVRALSSFFVETTAILEAFVQGGTS
jgi:hypothetical protein